MSHYGATAAFLGRLIGLGATDAVVSPGLRSVPLSLTAHAAIGLRLTIHHDERVGGFAALGIARATGRPVVVVCTSGSAGTNLLPAVVEAHQSRIPLIVVTADRPPELHGWESPQTIDQQRMFGSFAETMSMPVGEETSQVDAVDAAITAWRTSLGNPNGPVHINWPFREPLEPTGRIDVPVTGSVEEPRRPAGHVEEEAIAELAGATRGVIAVGSLAQSDREPVLQLAAATGWPIIADPLSGLRTPGAADNVITTGDHVLGHRQWADDHVPDVVLRIGAPPTSKSLRLWMERARPKSVVVVDPAGHRRDPSRTMTRLISTDVGVLAPMVANASPTPDRAWLDAWVAAERIARGAISEVAATAFEEAAATRATAEALGLATTWHVASSTPIRDVDWYVAETAATITSNRGANGIDGTIATALGLAIGSEAPTVVTLGDVALVHDIGGLMAAGHIDRRPTVIVYDNGGGGIFSLLPIADAADSAAFTDVLHTPTQMDLPAISAAAGYAYELVSDAEDLGANLDAAQGGDAGRLLHVPVTVEGARHQLMGVRSEIAARL
jgi:2-succinyl-5-enolpyruvyl-6-hydroxy-3-cyclohexene-1-carboxylate synthase